MEIYYQTDTPIAGFQFDVGGISITGASGGGAGVAGFMVSSIATTALGFSLSGATIPAGQAKLIELSFNQESSAICINNVIVSNESGRDMNFFAGECWVH